MDLPGPSNASSDTKLCQLCNIQTPKYTCPRCSIPYCSVECYKASSHLDCSEDFYKECVKDELKVRSNDPEDEQKIIDILKRFHEQSTEPQEHYDENEDDNLNLDGTDASDSDDDDDEVPDLADRIKNIDMDNADDLWAVLTDAERQEFEAMIRNGDVEKLLPQWTPWWAQVIEKKLIKEIEEDQKPADYEKNCPQIIHIPHFATLEKASPLIPYNLLNILYAYVVMALHYNGEYESSPKEAIEIFLQLNDVIGNDKIFENSSLAAESVLRKAVEYEMLSDESEIAELKDSVKKIIRGPEKDRQTYYMSAALSDLHMLFSKAKDKNCDTKQQKKPQFPRRLKMNFNSNLSNLTKKKLQFHIKKLEYYLAWINKCGVRMIELKID